jgi:hypothetical protein
MKKLLLALALLLLPATANATVSCSVPFNLTNGTTADATQVMANYNAILACLSTGAASSGSNSDITSLNGLTTPITPAQGGAIGLCGATGFTAKNNAGTPNTQIDIAFSQAVVVTPSNKVLQYGVNGAVTLNLGTAGVVNGLDAGTLTASTTYNTFLIGNGTLINSLASLSATAPALPAGYTGLCRVGSIRTNAATQLYKFFQGGRQISITQSVAGIADYLASGSVGTCFTSFAAQVFNGIPATATYAIGYVEGNNAVLVGVGRSVSSGATSTSWTNVTPGNHIDLFYEVALTTASTVFWCSNDPGNVLVVNGWMDSVNVN